MSSASADLLQELMRDAELVAAYGQRTGRMRDFELISALGAAHGLDPPAWNDPAILALQVALNRAVQDISPVMVSDLRDETWNPFRQRGPWYEQWPQLCFAAFALVLLALTSWSTLNYDRGTSLLTEIGALAENGSPATIGASVRKLQTVDLNSEDYYATVGSLKDLETKVTFYRQRANNFLRSVNDAQLAQPVLISTVLAQASEMLPANIVSSSTDNQYGPYDPCADLQPLLARSEKFPAVFSGTHNIFARQVLVLCNEKLSPELLDGVEYGLSAFKLRDWLDPWGRILLPALYGAFGSTVFYMRRVLDPTIRNPSFARVASRIAMGAFAGVIITWFWAPNNQLLSSFTSAGLTIFTAAFLIGFGVEVLFVLLDRLVTGAMAIAKGTEGRSSVIAPVYLTPAPPTRADTADPPGDKQEPAPTT